MLERLSAPNQPIAVLPPHHLPPQPTPFVGREREVAEILRRLQDPTCRLLTLVGLGGFGKTRLALEIARQLVELPKPLPIFAQGVFFVALQAVNTLSGVVSAIAEATGFRFYSDTPPRQQLLNFLREKRLLLVLDNMEHLTEGPGLVDEILSRAPGVKILVTSQRALHLREEWFFPLAGMTFPQSDERHPLPAFPRRASDALDAIQLFAQNARRTQPDFDLDAERQYVVRICRLVDGMPLALELAAGWLKSLPCQQIADEIERGLDILTATNQTISLRHRSIYAVLEQSWQLLAAEEQQILLRLAIFRGGFTGEAALAVANASLPALATLVEKALVWVTPTGRYHMHELLRQFVEKKLSATSDAEEAARTQHSDYYLRFLSQRGLLLVGKARRIALDEISQELNNVRAAWLWAAQQGRLSTLDGAVEPLYDFYQIQSRYQEGHELFDLARAHLEQAAATNRARATATPSVRVLARCAAFCYFLCDYEAASSYLQESLAQAQVLGQQREVAFVLNFLGQLAVWQGEQAAAQRYLLQSLAISREIGDRSGAASALEKLANLIHATFGEYVESKALAAESLALSRELGRPDWIAYALDTLGFVTFCLGEYADAEAYYRESLEIFEGIGDQYGQAMALGGLGLVLWAMWGGKLVEPTACFQKSLQICRTIGHQGQVAGRLAGLARIANDLGEYTQAQEYEQEGLTISRELGSPVYLSHILYCMGETAYGMGDLAAARAYLVEALQVTSQTGLLAYLGIALFHYANLLIAESVDQPEGTEGRTTALELLTLVQRHPATWYVYKSRAARQATQLETQLPVAIIAAAQARAAARSPETVVAELLKAQTKTAASTIPILNAEHPYSR